MTAPARINLFCTDADGGFIGRRDTLRGIMGHRSEYIADSEDIDATRWFRLDGWRWIETDTPKEWTHGFGTNDAWITDEIRKADA